MFCLVPHLSHVGPETTASSSLGEDELEGILETSLGRLTRAKHQVSRNLSEVWRSFLCWKFGIKTVNVLKVIIFQHASLHGILFLSPFGFFLLSFLISLTFNPFTAKYYKEVLVDSEARNDLISYPSFSNSIMMASLAVAAMINNLFIQF